MRNDRRKHVSRVLSGLKITPWSRRIFAPSCHSYCAIVVLFCDSLWHTPALLGPSEALARGYRLKCQALVRRATFQQRFQSRAGSGPDESVPSGCRLSVGSGSSLELQEMADVAFCSADWWENHLYAQGVVTLCVRLLSPACKAGRDDTCDRTANMP